jgi:hypothetical protein
MARGDLSGIANVSYAEITEETITWDTATDWDNAPDEYAVVHETYGDITDNTVIRMGHPSSDPFTKGLFLNHHFHEDSGSTAEDLMNNYDGSIQGPTVGVTGPFGHTAYSYDGTDDEVTLNSDSNLAVDYATNGISKSAWVKIDNTGIRKTILFTNDQNANFDFRVNENDVLEMWYSSTSSNPNITANTALSTNTWYHAGAVYDPGNDQIRLYLNGSQDGSGSATSPIDYHQISGNAYGMRGSNDDEPMAGDIGHGMAWEGVLAAAEFEELATAGGKTSNDAYLETATKSFSSTRQPDLSNLSYSLNSQTVELDVTGSPGTADEETVTQVLDGATSYTLTWSNSHTDFRIKARMNTAKPTVSPTVNAMSLTG